MRFARKRFHVIICWKVGTAMVNQVFSAREPSEGRRESDMSASEGPTAATTLHVEKQGMQAGPGTGALDEVESDVESGVTVPSDKKKKKKKPKKKASSFVTKTVEEIEENGGGVSRPSPPQPSDRATIDPQLQRGAKTYILPYIGLPDLPKSELALFLTPSCASLALRTERLILRQVQVGDLAAIRRIKTEPIVQKTQLYGHPGPLDIKPAFLTAYLASSIPRLTTDTLRRQYTFAITTKQPTSMTLRPPGQIKMTNRIKNAEGYIGNIALQLEALPSAEGLAPVAGSTWMFPTLDQWRKGQTTAKMFFEIHPQLWGNGIVSEAFVEVLRFAFEELGVLSVAADPCEGNEASIRICTKSHMTFSHRSTEAAKPQMFYKIDRAEWYRRNRPAEIDHWGGKRCCRWCFNFRAGEANERCEHCDWAWYCSPECRRADWVRQNGHQDECS